MNQEKIGKFIAERRKYKNMTQASLAEKLNITDRAVSKWERGKGMPDSSIMLNLCSELGISVNELLSGEVIEVENYDKKSEVLLLEMAKKEEQHNKRLMTAMWTIMAVSIVALLSVNFLVVFLVPEGPLQLLFVIGAVILFMIPCFIALKLETEAGFYECKNCHHKFVPAYKDVLWAMHMGTTRHLKCPHCQKKAWCKKVLK